MMRALGMRKMRIADRDANFWRDGELYDRRRAETERKALYNKRRTKRHDAQYHRAWRRSKAATENHVAVMDMETDPFDAEGGGDIYPFLVVLYSDQFEPIIIWDENWRGLCSRLISVVENLPGKYTIYAHNGGRFDYLFLLHELRGQVMFKGRALMSARIGKHEIRDSFHILPEKLQSINGKDDISYNLMEKRNRRKEVNKKKIIDYCIADCRYLFESVMAFRERFGAPLTIGQAAIRELKKSYDIQNLDNQTDLFLRTWFYGGRVDCYRYGIIPGDFRLYDVNSMYPFVMASRSHPIGREIFINNRIRDGFTAFITLRCKNRGALVARGDNGNLTTGIREGIFNCTIWEYETACRNNLITDCEIIRTVEFAKWSNFGGFVDPIYARRKHNKELLDAAIRSNNLADAKNLRFAVLFDKLLLNNAYGKLAQNPRRFKDHLILATGDEPPTCEWGFHPEIEADDYAIWSKPNPEFRFNNVGTAASITGAARAVLLDSLCRAKNPLYCDTDSIICESLPDNVACDAFQLGAWDCETPIITFVGNGKKLYAYEKPDHSKVVRAKGINNTSWEDMIKLANGGSVSKTLIAPTIGKDGSQQYITRVLRQTGVPSWDNLAFGGN
jgi:hypothetical protein